MKMIPLLRVKNIGQAVSFYTEILDFELTHPEEELNIFCVDLFNNGAEVQLSQTDGIFGIAINVSVDDVDKLFAKYRGRGLDASAKKESPVHQSPLDQSWGRREFYVTDPDGNTLRFTAPVKQEQAF